MLVIGDVLLDIIPASFPGSGIHFHLLGHTELSCGIVKPACGQGAVKTMRARHGDGGVPFKYPTTIAVEALFARQRGDRFQAGHLNVHKSFAAFILVLNHLHVRDL